MDKSTIQHHLKNAFGTNKRGAKHGKLYYMPKLPKKDNE
jgi:hypothetical protein